MTAASANGLTAPELGAVSQFQAGAQYKRLDRVRALAQSSLRDGLRWHEIEQQDGLYRFDHRSGRYVSDLIEEGMLGSLTLHPSSNRRNNGATAADPEQTKAFADYVAAVAQQFPGLRLEIGNEFNSSSFLSGPAKDLSVPDRARLHAAHILAIAETGAVAQDRLLAGAAHSVAAGYIWAVLDQGVADHISAIALHPYTSPAEVLPAHLEVLRRHPAMQKLAIEITEFGIADDRNAPDHFWRNYCKMALANVRRAVWYPFDARRDQYSAVIDRQLNLTPVGRAITFAQTKLAGRKVEESFANQPYLHGCLFDDRTLVFWGEPREIRLNRPDIQVRHGHLRQLPSGDLSRPTETTVRILTVPEDAAPLVPGRDLSLGDSPLVADSYVDFHYPIDDEALSDPTPRDHPFTRWLQRGPSVLPLITCPGQDRPKAPWRPYLCAKNAPAFTLTEKDVTLIGAAVGTPLTLVMAHRVSHPRDLRLEVDIAVRRASRDGLQVQLWKNDQEIAQRHVLYGMVEEPWIVTLPGVSAGDLLQIRLANGPTDTGDFGSVRVRIFDENLFYSSAP
ncbi:hypothetical protein [Tritonibacter multivorans]|nr:hypothetical protein [Tritonibacter multivorans]MDA7421972.1 hypothetical protein [Tritonibacter multivorans]